MSKTPFKRIPPPQCTREEAIEVIQDVSAKLGRPPKRYEVPDRVRYSIKPLFGKWIYALEAAEVRMPSENVQSRREKHRVHWQEMRDTTRRLRTEKRQNRQDSPNDDDL